jgi:hypothetical protein
MPQVFSRICANWEIKTGIARKKGLTPEVTVRAEGVAIGTSLKTFFGLNSPVGIQLWVPRP